MRGLEVDHFVPYVAGSSYVRAPNKRPRPCVDRFCGGLWLDIKRKIPWFCSDIYDGFHIQSISAVLFIYLGCITNAITFGGLLGDATENYQVLSTLLKDHDYDGPIRQWIRPVSQLNTS